MPTLSYLISCALYLLVAFAIFRKTRADYRRFGQLTRTSACLQPLAFTLHGFLMNLPASEPVLARVYTAPASTALGIFVILLGSALLLAALGVFGPFTRALGRRVDALKQSGVYARTRNPQIVGYGLIVQGFALLWPNWTSPLGLLLYAATAHWMVGAEEEHLLRVNGEEYRDYCRRTPRYFGLLSK